VKEGEAMTANKIGAFVGSVPEEDGAVRLML
jgi:hypothetical protein